MTDANEAFSEGAKAAQEIAKTGGKVVDAASQFGGFVSTYVAGPLEQGMGIFEDKLRFMRWERKLRMMNKAKQLMNEVGLEAPNRQVPLKLAIPLLEGASLEDDDSLQDMWAALLVNATNNSSGINLRRAYIDLLSQISAEEALILQMIYKLPYKATSSYPGVIVGDLPNSVSAQHRNAAKESEIIYAFADENNAVPPAPKRRLTEPREDMVLALANLARIGCITLESTASTNQQFFHRVTTNILGKSFVDSCTLQRRPAQ